MSGAERRQAAPGDGSVATPVATPISDSVVDEVLDELAAASSKFGPFASPHEGYAVILEELDELWAEVKRDRGYGVAARMEAIQIAAMALRYVVDVSDS